jgi:DNA-binding transcriptional LysR family regulator
LHGLDLNLLRVFDALADERNVTRAAQRLGLSQSALSHALGRLRHLLGDELFVRARDGMVLTPRAEKLALGVRDAFERLDAALTSGAGFDPAASRQRFQIGASDYAEVTLLPRLIARLRTAAPAADVVVRVSGEDNERLLESGVLDVVLETIPAQAPTLRSRELVKDRFVCLVSADHPTVKRTLSLKQYVELPHALVSQRGRPSGVVDRALEREGLRRRVGCIVPHFLAAPHVVAHSDLIVTIGERIARAYGPALGLRILSPPLMLPEFSLRMFWHARSHRDAPSRWLRAQIVSAAT